MGGESYEFQGCEVASGDQVLEFTSGVRWDKKFSQLVKKIVMNEQRFANDGAASVPDAVVAFVVDY